MSVGSQPISNGSARTSCFWQSVSAEPKQSARAKAAQRPRPWRFGVSVSVVLGGSFVFPSASLSFAVLGSVFQSHHAAPRASCSSPLSYTSALPFRGEYACPRLLSCPFWPSRALRAFACIHKCTSLSTSPPLLLLLLLPAEPRLTSTRLAPPAEAPVRWPPLSTLRRVDTHCLLSGPPIQFDRPRPPLFSCTCTAAWDACSCASHPQPRRPPRSSAAACQ